MIALPWWVVMMAVGAVGALVWMRELFWDRQLFNERKLRMEAEHIASVWQEAHGAEQRRKRSAQAVGASGPLANTPPWGVQGGSA